MEEERRVLHGRPHHDLHLCNMNENKDESGICENSLEDHKRRIFMHFTASIVNTVLRTFLNTIGINIFK